MAKTESGDPWGKRGIYLRMSKRRKARLLAIAKELGHEDSPHRALAAYIENENVNAADDASDSHDALEDKIVDALDQRLGGLARSVASMESRIAALIENLGDALSPLGELISSDAPGPQALAQWLSKAESDAGMKIEQAALIHASWRATRASADGKVALEFDADLLRMDDRTDFGRLSGPARIDGLAPSDPLAAALHASMGSGLYLACQPMGNRIWSAAAFRCNPDGTIGAQVASFSF